ncbi:MAG TPA: hypothetical protein VHM64_12280 [Candidatus Binatia bacterium]|nr:hypothetical protein [Candidatus Binatia bacterium]
MKTQITSAVALALLSFSIIPARAEYTLLLKNGRRITVQSYREDNGVVKFTGLGGEIGIAKEQILTIREGDGAEAGDFDLTRTEAAPAAGSDAARPAQEGREGKNPADEERAREEQQYLSKLKELNERLKATQDAYAESIRGNAGPDPMQLITDEQVRARQDDLSARFKDAQNNPSEPAPVKLLNPSPFSSLPPSVTEVQPTVRTPSPYEAPQTFTPREQGLLELRNQAVELERERERLLEEMRQKNLSGGATLQ